MGICVPPPPITEEEFDRRVAAGARTMEEIDPRLNRWSKNMMKQRMIQGIFCLLGIFILILTFAWLAINSIGA
jgi:hypothetical protein